MRRVDARLFESIVALGRRVGVQAHPPMKVAIGRVPRPTNTPRKYISPVAVRQLQANDTRTSLIADP